MKKLVFSFGRFNPPTTGHEVLLKKVVAVAKKENADAMVYSSQSNDPKKNPLPYKEKTKFMQAMFPKHKKVIQYDVGVKNAFDTLSTVYAKGYRDVTMVVGSDRVTEFEKILNKYNDVEGRHGYYNFESGVKVVSAGARDPDAEGVTGMSASKMRAAAAANDFESFEKGMPVGFKGGQSVFDAVRKGMNLSEEMMEFLGSDIKEFRTFMNADIIEMLDDMDDEELFETIDEDFGAVPDFATMVAFGMAAKMSVDAVKILWRTARGANKIRKWAKRNGNKLRDKVNPAPNFTQFESLDENVLGRYATAGRKMRKRDNAAKDAVQAAGGKDPRTSEPETPEEWMARREYHLKYAAKKGMTQPMKDLISKKTMGIHKKSASECREIHNIITGTKIDASGNWKPNEKFAVREYPHSTPDHITREYNKKREQYRKRLQSLQTSEHEDTKDLKRRTERPWYDAMKKHFASNGMFSDVPKPDPLDFGITWDIRDGKMPHRPYMESVQNGLIGLDQIKKFESVVDKLFAKYDIDFNFTRHFGDRMDDSRNSPSITLKELAEFIKKMYKRQGKSIKSVAGAEAVLKDIQSDLNIPVAVTYDRNNDEFDVVLKTIMRKKNFTSPDKVIKYEENDMTNQLPEGFMDAILGKKLKMNESRVKNVVRGMGVDPDLVMRGMGKGPHAAKDKARAAKEPKKTLKSRAKNVARGMGVDPDNVMRGMGFKEASELDELKINMPKNMQEVKQDSDVEDKKGSQPSKYYAKDADGDKMSKSTKEKRAAYFAKGGSKKPAPGDSGAKTKESKHTKKYKKMFGETKPCWDGYVARGMKKKGDKMVPNCVPEETVNEAKIDGLVKKSEKSGISYGILKKVYDRGMAAWKGGHRPGTTAQQWAFARVNSFVTKGKGTWGKADKDLAAKVRSESFLPFNEKLDPNKDDMSDYVKDFKKSKAPQFKGKSDDKRKQMAVAAYLAAKEKTESVDEDRDYKKERENYLGTPKQMERNAARSRARRLAIKKGMAERGDGKDIHHKDNNPMNNDPKNLSSVTQKYNRSEPRKRK